MGNRTPERIHQKVVIVGGSFAGLTIAMELWDIFEVVIIDQKDYFEYIATVTRAITQEGFYDQLVIPYKELMEGNQNKASFIQARLEKVESDRSILITKQGKQEPELLEFDFLVICTGSQYQKPIKDIPVVSLADRKKGIKEELDAIHKAESVLVVGAGAVGVETAGELAFAFRGREDKRIGIVSRSQALLPYFPPNAQTGALNYLQQNRVSCHLGESFDEAFQQKHKYQHVIHCQGLTYGTSFMNNEQFMDCLSPRGQIFVNRHMQVTNVNPLQVQIRSLNNPEPLKENKVYRNVFCVGDTCLTSLNEEKSIFPLKQMSKICSSNIIALARGSNILEALPDRLPSVYGITLGPEYGLFIINDYVIAGRLPANMKNDIQDINIRLHRGDERAKGQIKSQNRQTWCLFCCCNSYLCCCCPCSTKRRRALRQEKKNLKKE